MFDALLLVEEFLDAPNAAHLYGLVVGFGLGFLLAVDLLLEVVEVGALTFCLVGLLWWGLLLYLLVGLCLFLHLSLYYNN